MHTPAHPENLNPGDLITILDYLDPPPTSGGRRVLNTPHPYLQPGIVLSVVSHSHPFLAISWVTSLSGTPPYPTIGPYTIDLRRCVVTHLSPAFVDACAKAATSSLKVVPPPPVQPSVELSHAPDPNQLDLYPPGPD